MFGRVKRQTDMQVWKIAKKIIRSELCLSLPARLTAAFFVFLKMIFLRAIFFLEATVQIRMKMNERLLYGLHVGLKSLHALCMTDRLLSVIEI